MTKDVLVLHGFCELSPLLLLLLNLPSLRHLKPYIKTPTPRKLLTPRLPPIQHPTLCLKLAYTNAEACQQPQMRKEIRQRAFTCAQAKEIYRLKLSLDSCVCHKTRCGATLYSHPEDLNQ